MANHEQDSNALFFQIMCVLHGNGYAEPTDGKLIPDLSDAIFYMDFARVFDRSAANKKQRIRQEKARAMFRPEGVRLNFGSGPHRYVAFERSGSMSRQARLSFIRAIYMTWFASASCWAWTSIAASSPSCTPTTV